MDEIKKSEENIKNENCISKDSIVDSNTDIGGNKEDISSTKKEIGDLEEKEEDNHNGGVEELKQEKKTRRSNKTINGEDENEINEDSENKNKQNKEEKIANQERTKKINKIIEESFEKIKFKNNILAYKEKTLSFEKLSSHCTDPELVVVDLSINKKIEEQFLNKFDVVNLPCLIAYGLKIYDNENLEYNLKEKEERELNFYKEKVKGLVNRKKIFIFIKGTPEQPKCKYTKELLGILNELSLQNGLDFDYFNIFSNEILRDKLKIITEWPTYPQIFIKGKFIGGINSLNALKEQNLINEVLK